MTVMTSTSRKIIRHFCRRAAGCFFEITIRAPTALILMIRNAKIAKDAGIKIAINTDAHSERELNLIDWGIHQGRRAWLSRSDVLELPTFYPVACAGYCGARETRAHLLKLRK